jgi:hypothetical protein
MGCIFVSIRAEKKSVPGSIEETRGWGEVAQRSSDHVMSSIAQKKKKEPLYFFFCKGDLLNFFFF